MEKCVHTSYIFIFGIFRKKFFTFFKWQIHLELPVASGRYLTSRCSLDRLLWKIKRFMTYAILLRLCLKVVMNVINFTTQFNFGFRFWQIDIEQIVSPFLMIFLWIQSFENSPKKNDAVFQTTGKVSDSITNYCRQSNFHPFPYIINLHTGLNRNYKSSIIITLLIYFNVPNKT